ncbi:PREDICTED: protein GPR108-like isoform X5 [Cyprinodon variegatus]|uniref:protein GPR108-like isoform X3 n=1 Tax=Cyprinodon variegatus TaxID=28743 RepID=UPI000742820A|nr:PREDICTED: protein GPR108-like isoform X3 [Cyprinodon variegatus]XP_015238728.1 PREDICTED: protein GPR108-like isoform X4 [Cyprinodon variegatus]XP_015238729.1 PREDICTED: protein GPR108-like isoform X5 [Cyprinodon variegatus]
MAVSHINCFVAWILLCGMLSGSNARIHKLILKNETRFAVDLNNFGFFANGTLDVNLTSLGLNEKLVNYSIYPVGFSLSRSRVNGVLPYTAEESEDCPLAATKPTNDEPLILFLIDIIKMRVNVYAMGNQDNVLIAKAKSDKAKERKVRDDGNQQKPADSNKVKPAEENDSEDGKKTKTAGGNSQENGQEGGQPSQKNAQEGGQPSQKNAQEGGQPSQKNAQEGGQQSTNKEQSTPFEEAKKVEGTTFLLNQTTKPILALDKIKGFYNFSFQLVVGPKAEGLYSLKFHYCQNRMPGIRIPYSLRVDVTETNPGSFLSAAEIPLSRLYICMAGVFFAAALVWVYTLMKHRYSVFKIHWLMAALAFTKSTSLVFHSINYHFINTQGRPIEGWAVMYYITHLLKGALLFITLALIGTGWAFVKYILSDKEKKIFMIVIPLQVLANVAFIIIESTEEGTSEYYLWKEILFLVDLICCGAILFPVVWSIRHLQEASSTDGKAAMNLEKLKLFRHYYVMIVCYIYFTRIIAILLKITMPFQWQWCYEFLVEVSTLIFFVLTGYKFRPASNNPYLQLPQDEEDVEMDEVVTESGALEGISKVKKTSNGRERQKEPAL